MSAIINETTMKRIESLAAKHQQNVNDYLNTILDEEEKYDDPEYIEFCQRTEKSWKEYDEGKYKEMTVDEFMNELEEL